MTMMRMVMLIVYISSTLHTYIYTYIHDGERLCIGVRYIFTPCAHAERGRERERERERERDGEEEERRAEQQHCDRESDEGGYDDDDLDHADVVSC